jgi:hypothetical protein
MQAGKEQIQQNQRKSIFKAQDQTYFSRGVQAIEK